MREITEIIIHCSATPEGREVTAKDIDRWHRQRGFRCIGYHFLIKLDGMIELGRPIEEVGAHCTNHNQRSVGICYVGGLSLPAEGEREAPKDTRTEAQKVTLRNLVLLLKMLFPKATIHGHNEFANKACPCFDVKSEFPD